MCQRSPAYIARRHNLPCSLCTRLDPTVRHLLNTAPDHTVTAQCTRLLCRRGTLSTGLPDTRHKQSTLRPRGRHSLTCIDLRDSQCTARMYQRRPRSSLPGTGPLCTRRQQDRHHTPNMRCRPRTVRRGISQCTPRHSAQCNQCVQSPRDKKRKARRFRRQARRTLCDIARTRSRVPSRM